MHCTKQIITRYETSTIGVQLRIVGEVGYDIYTIHCIDCGSACDSTFGSVYGSVLIISIMLSMWTSFVIVLDLGPRYISKLDTWHLMNMYGSELRKCIRFTAVKVELRCSNCYRSSGSPLCLCIVLLRCVTSRRYYSIVYSLRSLDNTKSVLSAPPSMQVALHNSPLFHG